MILYALSILKIYLDIKRLITFKISYKQKFAADFKEIMVNILALNTGSSSLKFACYSCSNTNEELLYTGSLTRIGLPLGNFTVKGANRLTTVCIDKEWSTIDDACKFVFEWIYSQGDSMIPVAVGHRIVHGGEHTRSQLVDVDLMDTLHSLSPYAPEHLPPALKTLSFANQFYSSLPQIACFDTSFHRTMPMVAETYSLPQELRKRGLKKYGFHGLSYQYIMSELQGIYPNSDFIKKRIVIAHLGHGASMAAIANGVCQDTTMGFSPTGGLVMSSRIGDIDPEIVLFLLEHEHVAPSDIKNILNKKSGMKGISEGSDDMRDLLALENDDAKAKLAVEMFVYSCRKHLGALIAALGGLDILVFCAGIGEKSCIVRERICDAFRYMGLLIDNQLNESNSCLISSTESRVDVRVISTNEEVIISRETFKLLAENKLI